MFVTYNDLRVNVRLDGPDGSPPLLLLHSLGTSNVIWDRQAEVLQRSFRVIRPDLRGHGSTTTTPGPYDIEGLARDARGVLDALSIETAHVAGISIGGMIAQSLALQAPERVLSLILLDTALSMPPPEFWLERAARVRAEGIGPLADGIIERWVTPGFRAAPETGRLRDVLMRTPPEGYAGGAEAIAAANFAEASKKIRARTLVLVGREDKATPVASAELLQCAIPGAKLCVLTEAAHISTVEQPGAVLEAMSRFLSELPVK